MYYAVSIPALEISVLVFRAGFLLTLTLLLGTAACSPSRDMPTVPAPEIDYQKCRGMTLKLNHLTADAVQSMVRCLNSNGGLQEIQDWLQATPQENLNEAFGLWNQVIGDNEIRFDQTLSVIDRLRKESFEGETHLDSLSRQLAGLIDSGFAHASLQALHVVDQRSRKEMGESFLKSIFKTAAARQSQGAEILSNKSSSRFQMLARLTDNNVAQWMAQRLVSQQLAVQSSETSGLSATEALQLSLLVLSDIHARGDLQKVWKKLKMPSTQNVFPANLESALEIEGYLNTLTSTSEGAIHLQSLKNLATDFDRPLKCFVSSSQSSSRSLQIKNVFDLIVQEQALRHEQPAQLTSFLLRDMNLLIGIVKEQCDVDEATQKSLSLGAEYFQTMTLRGHSQGHAQLLQLFQKAGRISDLKTLIQSQDILELAPLISFFSQRGLLAPALVQANQYLSQEEFSGITDFVGSAVTQLPRVDWIFQVASESSGEIPRALDQAFRSGFDYVSRSDSGFGSLFTVLTRVEATTAEAPFFEALNEVVAKPEMTEQLLKTYPALIDRAEFEPALRRVGKMANSGELKKLIGFVVDLHRAAGRNRLSGDPVGWSYEPATKLPLTSASSEVQLKSDLWLSTITKCEKSREGVGTANGLESAMQCLSADGEMKSLGRLSEVLKQNRFLEEAAVFARQGLLKKELVPAAVDTLRALEKKHFFQVLNSLDTNVDNKVLFRDLEFFLATPVLLSDAASQFLQCVGKTARETNSLSELLNWGSTFLDRREQKAVAFQLNYVIPIHNEGSLRAQLDTFPELKSLSASEREKQFQLAMKEFRERNHDYFYRQKAYRKYSTEDLKTELETYVKAFLNHTNLEEILTALGDLSHAQDPGFRGSVAGLDLTRAIDQLVGTQRAIPFYPAPNEAPQVRIVTPLDQLELLVMNVDVEMAQWMPVIGQDNMGMFYMWNVAESTNLPFTLGLMHQAMHGGYVYTKLQERHKHYMLQNDRINFYVLQQMANDGSLKLFQRIYQALHRATPEAFRRSQDRTKNQIYIAHWPMKYTFFARLVPLLSELRDRGQLRPFLDGLFGLGRLYQASDGPMLRKILQKMANEKVRGKTILRHFLDRIFLVSEKPAQGYALLSRAFQMLTVGMRLGLQPRGLLTALDQILSSPELALKLIDMLFDDLSDSEFSYFGHLGAGIHLAPVARAKAIRTIGGQWFEDSKGQCADALSSVLLKFRAVDSERSEALVKRLSQGISASSEKTRTRMKQLLSIVSEVQRAEPGLSQQTSFVLQDSGLRGALVKILHLASTEGLFTSLITELFLPSEENGKNEPSRIQELIQFINRTFQDVSGEAPVLSPVTAAP